jgi:predicted nucleic-acid-binding Zn-ribbon protein
MCRLSCRSPPLRRPAPGTPRPLRHTGTDQRISRQQRRLRYSHFSPLAGLPDAPENYHAVTIDLTADNEQATRVALSQDNNKTKDARDHAEKNWNAMLANLKKVIDIVHMTCQDCSRTKLWSAKTVRMRSCSRTPFLFFTRPILETSKCEEFSTDNQTSIMIFVIVIHLIFKLKTHNYFFLI